ncbi:hypothetical protein XENOCAPTIV_023931 [Xenoophorus captivus]|uniref:Uncharacterized protein n=1 Tax=Xenoophorus captivus TaxID=1517983 RepID=A0ABV0Q6T2_9TELE
MQPPSPATPTLQHPHIEARATMHRTTTPKPHPAIQRRAECSNEHRKRKPCTKPTPCKCDPTSPPKTKPPAKVHPLEKKTHSIQVQEHARHPYRYQNWPHKKTHTEAHKRQRAHRAKTKTHQEAETTPPQIMPTSPTSLPQTEPGPA